MYRIESSRSSFHDNLFLICTKNSSKLLIIFIRIPKSIHASMKCSLLIFLTLFYVRLYNQIVRCTIDVNLSELEYLAGHLDPFECIRLVAALHYTTYELPQSIAGAERKVDEEIPCLRQLIHWNSSPTEGRGKTHEAIEHRLRQLNRNDLADWLGKTSFQQLGKDLEKALDNPFGDLGEQDAETEYPITIDPLDEPSEEDAWLPIDTLLMALLVGLLGTLFALIVALIIHKIRARRYERRSSVSKTNSKERVREISKKKSNG